MSFSHHYNGIDVLSQVGDTSYRIPGKLIVLHALHHHRIEGYDKYNCIFSIIKYSFIFAVKDLSLIFPICIED
jgi:hypothetical protein